MPSKRKRSGPGASHRDDDGGSKYNRPRFEQGGNGKGKGQSYRVQSRSISGPGILVSCVQGKERKAALQFIDLLNETADRIYPGVVPLPRAVEAKKLSEAKEEDDMDSLRNGPSTSSVDPTRIASPPAPVKDAEDDIAAQIAAELQDIKASERRGPRSYTVERFRKIETDTECLVFISVAAPLDPMTLVLAILDKVEETGEPGTRFVQRLSPVSGTCHADFNSLVNYATQLLPRSFPAQGPGRTFKIDPRIRSHSTLKRADVIQAIAQSIPVSDTDARRHSANLNNPDVWIVVEILKNTAAISVLEHFDRYKKYNLQMVADAANARKAELKTTQDEESGRIASSLTKTASVSQPEHPAEATVPDVQAELPPPTDSDTTEEPMAGFRLF